MFEALIQKAESLDELTQPLLSGDETRKEDQGKNPCSFERSGIVRIMFSLDDASVFWN